jgi:hypothetical protein
MKPDWDKLGKEYAKSKTVLIGDVDCTVHQGLCGEQGVQGYPTIKYKVKGSNKWEAYNGGRDFAGLKKFVSDKLDTGPACSLESLSDCEPGEKEILETGSKMSKAELAAKLKELKGEIETKKAESKKLEKEVKKLTADLEIWEESGNKPEMTEQLLSDEDFRAHCESRTCVLAFLPHILDDQAAGRKKNIAMVDAARKANKADGGPPMGFMWLQGGDNFDLEEKLGLQFGFPAMVVLNLKKEKFAVYRGVWAEDDVKKFVKKPTGLAPLPPKLPAFAKSAPWDGLDAKAEEL